MIVIGWVGSVAPSAGRPEPFGQAFGLPLAALPLVSMKYSVLTPLPPLPWDRDFAVLPAAQADLKMGGLKALAPHAQDFQAALDDGKQYFPDGAVVDGKRYVLVDGPTESLGAMIKAATAHDGVPAVAVGNAYPLIGLELGLYYDEVGRPEDAH